MKNQILFMLKGGEVERYHTLRTIQSDTVGYHSFGVAWFCYFLRAECSSQLLLAAMAHDLAEHRVGDTPAPTKRELGISEKMAVLEDGILADNGFMFHITDEEKRILKLADCAQGALFCTRERSLGNRGVEIVWERYMSYMREKLTQEPREQELVTTLYQLWEDARDGRL